MGLTLEKKTVEAEKMVGSAQVQVPLRAESAPTGQREAAEVLWEDARLAISATARDGGVQVDGVLYCQALYRLEGDSALRTAECESRFQEMVEIADAGKEMTARCRGEVEHLEAEYTGGRVVFTATVNLEARVTALFQEEVAVSAQGEGIEAQTESCTLRKLTAESATVTNLRDEVDIPPALRARGVLAARSTVKGLECRREPDGVRVGGEIFVETLIRCGVEARPVAMVKYALPFEQLLTFPDWVEGEAEGGAMVRSLSCQLDGEQEEGATLKIACEVEVSAELYQEQALTVVTDVYGCGSSDVEAQKTRMKILSGEDRIQGREEFRGEMLLSESAAGVGTVLAVRAQPYISEVEGDTARGIVEAVCLYVPAGREQVACARGEMPFEIRLSEAPGSGVRVRAEAADAEAMSVVSDRMEVRCALTANCLRRREIELEAVQEISEMPAPSREAAIIVRRAAMGETLWDIARQYRVPMAEMRRLNPDMENPAAGDAVYIWR